MTVSLIPFSDIAGSRRPALVIDIVNPHANKKVMTTALIDTGAYASALPGSLAEALGHDLTKGRQRKIGTGNGVTIAYEHTTSMTVINPKDGSIITELDTVLVDYMPALSVCLLGVRNFLEHFVLTVNYPSRCFSLSIPG